MPAQWGVPQTGGAMHLFPLRKYLVSAPKIALDYRYRHRGRYRGRNRESKGANPISTAIPIPIPTPRNRKPGNGSFSCAWVSPPAHGGLSQKSELVIRR